MQVLLAAFAIVSLLTMTCCQTYGETLPREGAFTGNFFVDRWGQGVFDIFFVAPEFIEDMPKNSTLPIKLTTKNIRQWMNPGGAMIHQIERLETLTEPPLKIALKVDTKAIDFGERTKLHVQVENVSDRPIKLYRRQFHLMTTIHRRGTHPKYKIGHDEIFDCLHSTYVSRDGKIRVVRATSTTDLLTDDGELRSALGSPGLVIQREGEWKAADIYDTQYPVISPGKSVEFTYDICGEWLINEYEFRAVYKHWSTENTDTFVASSAPLSFDVTDTKNGTKGRN